MATRELFPDESKPRYVTFALPREDAINDSRFYGRRVHESKERHEFLYKFGACLVFGTNGVTPVKTMRSVARSFFVYDLFGQTFWLTGYRDKVVAGSHIVGNKIPLCYGFARQGNVFVWPKDRVMGSCTKLEALLGCYACPGGEKDSSGCCEEVIKRFLLEEENIEGPFPSLEKSHREETLTDPDDIQKFLQQMAPKSGWEYIKPGLFAGPHETRLGFVSEINMDEANDELEYARARWKTGRQTIAAKKICEAECYLSNFCESLEKPYYSAPQRCQTNFSEHREPEFRSRDVSCGPYRKEEMHKVFELFRKSIDARSPEEIAQIACNAGTSTYIFGYELQLCKMAENMRDVEFVRPYGMERVTYSYEDAMTLLHTPYRDCYNNKSVYYMKPRMEFIGARMSVDELDIYTEICQYTCVKDYCTAFPGCYATPHIQTVLWRPQLDFHVTLQPGYDLHINHLARIGPIVGSWRPIPGVVSRNPDLLKGVRAREDRESSRDKQP